MSEQKSDAVTVELPRLRVSPNHPLIRRAEKQILTPQLVEAFEQFKITGLEHKHLVVKNSSIPNAGLGVFATENLNVDDAIEFCHSIVLDTPKPYIHDPKITQYAYYSDEEPSGSLRSASRVVLPLGYGMIYNSAPSQAEANCDFFSIAGHNLVVFLATKPIAAGQEILTWWGQGYYDAWCRPRKKKEEHNEDKKEQPK